MEKIKVIRFYPQDWGEYKEDLMALERAWEDNPELCFSEELKKELLTDPEVIAYIALDGEKCIGENYGHILQNIDKDDFFEGHWDPGTYRHFDKKTLYVTSIATLPDYAGMGIAKALTYQMLVDAKNDGFEFVVGHYNEGAMTGIIEWFNGETVEVCPEWFGSDETHNLMEIDLSKIPMLLPVNRLKQNRDYDCGIASSAVLFGLDVVPRYDEVEISFGLTPELGISHEDLIYYNLKVNGFRLSSQYNCKISDIVEKIKAKKLTIVNYLSKDEEGDEDHYSVIYGYDEENVYLMDVWDGKEKKMSNEDFQSVWYSEMFGKGWMAWR